MDGELLLRSGGSGFLGTATRWILGLLVVGAATAGAAYYLPLVRAHRALSEQFSVLQKRADEDEAALKRAKADLSSAKADREKLEERQGQLAAKEQAEKDRSNKLRDVLSTKLTGFTRSHLAVTPKDSGAAVILPQGLVRMQGAELTEPGKGALCSVVKAMSAIGPLTYRVGAYVAHADATGPGAREQAASRATSAAKALEEKCAVPGTRILAAGYAQPPAEGAPAGDVLELDVATL